MPNDEAIRILNDLLEVSKDGEVGFRRAWEKVSDPSLKLAFKEMSQSCAKAVAQLERAVHDLGGEPSMSGSATGVLHRGWIEARTRVAGDPTQALLDEVVRGEEYAVRKYGEALQQQLPPVMHAIVDAQARGARDHLARVRALREQVVTSPH